MCRYNNGRFYLLVDGAKPVVGPERCMWHMCLGCMLHAACSLVELLINAMKLIVCHLSGLEWSCKAPLVL